MESDLLLKRLGRTIRNYREAASHSQDTFADSIGMHRAYYSAIERGERNMTIQTLHRVANGLGLRLGELISRADI